MLTKFILQVHRAHRHREKRAEEKKEQEMAQLPAVPKQFEGETPGCPGAPGEDELLAILRRCNCEHLLETLRAENIDGKVPEATAFAEISTTLLSQALEKLSIADLRAAGIILGDAIKIHECARPFATVADSDGVLAPLPGMRDDALYVWCVCWRRIYICRVGKTRYGGLSATTIVESYDTKLCLRACH